MFGDEIIECGDEMYIQQKLEEIEEDVQRAYDIMVKTKMAPSDRTQLMASIIFERTFKEIRSVRGSLEI